MRHLSLAWIAFLTVVVVLSPVPVARSSTVEERAVLVSNQVLKLLKRCSNLQKSQARAVCFWRITRKRFDFATFVRLTCGEWQTRLSANQHKQLTALFRKLFKLLIFKRTKTSDRMLTAYQIKHAKRLKRWWNQNQTAVVADGNVVIKQRSKGVEHKYSAKVLLVRSRHTPQWKVADLVIEGHGLVGTWRTQVQHVLREKGCKALVELLKRKINKLQQSH